MTKKKDAISIDTVTLRMGGKNVELTIEQARSLRDLLNDTFPEVDESAPTFIYRDRYYPVRPWWERYQTWCGSGTSGGSITVTDTPHRDQFTWGGMMNGGNLTLTASTK